MDRVYISGPISHIRQSMMNFDKAEFDLENKGYDTYNPFSIRLPDTEEEKKEYNEIGEWVWYMRRCIPELVNCDAVLMLPNWKESKGAKLERELAETLKIKVYESIEDIDELRKS
jgi:nucleoside 2-deoxyribosyltransferase